MGRKTLHYNNNNNVLTLQIVFIVHKVKPVPTHDSVYSVIYI